MPARFALRKHVVRNVSIRNGIGRFCRCCGRGCAGINASSAPSCFRNGTQAIQHAARQRTGAGALITLDLLVLQLLLIRLSLAVAAFPHPAGEHAGKAVAAVILIHVLSFRLRNGREIGIRASCFAIGGLSARTRSVIAIAAHHRIFIASVALEHVAPNLASNRLVDLLAFTKVLFSLKRKRIDVILGVPRRLFLLSGNALHGQKLPAVDPSLLRHVVDGQALDNRLNGRRRRRIENELRIRQTNAVNLHVAQHYWRHAPEDVMGVGNLVGVADGCTSIDQNGRKPKHVRGQALKPHVQGLSTRLSHHIL